MGEITRIRLDWAKHAFQVHGIDAEAKQRKIHHPPIRSAGKFVAPRRRAAA